MWEKGGAGGEALGAELLTLLDKKGAEFRPLYPTDLPIKEKIDIIVRQIYGGDGADYTPEADRAIAYLESIGLGNTPVCMAKTQYSLTDDAAEARPPARVPDLRQRGARVGRRRFRGRTVRRHHDDAGPAQGAGRRADGAAAQAGRSWACSRLARVPRLCRRRAERRGPFGLCTEPGTVAARRDPEPTLRVFGLSNCGGKRQALSSFYYVHRFLTIFTLQVVGSATMVAECPAVRLHLPPGVHPLEAVDMKTLRKRWLPLLIAALAHRRTGRLVQVAVHRLGRRGDASWRR